MSDKLYEDNCVELLAPLIAANRKIKGPFETAYGFGYYPTVTYWIGRRRFHIHWHPAEDLCIEIADLDTKTVRQRLTQDIAIIQDTMLQFLVRERSATDFSEPDWFLDKGDHDKFIPDPPDSSNPANLCNWVGGHGTSNPIMKPTKTVASQPPLENKGPWWRFW